MRKVKKYDDIQANSKPSFEMLYYNAIRALKILHKEIKPHKNSQADFTLQRIQHKLEQMVAKWKCQRTKDRRLDTHE